MADLRKVGDNKRLALLISVVHECRTAARDEVTEMFCKRMAALHKKGRERREERHQGKRCVRRPGRCHRHVRHLEWVARTVATPYFNCYTGECCYFPGAP